MDFDTDISVIARDPVTGYFFRAWLLGVHPSWPGMFLVQRVGVEGMMSIAAVYEYGFDNIGDPVEATGNRRIEFRAVEQYSPNQVNPPGIYRVYGPCNVCGRYYSNFQRHVNEEFGVCEDDLLLF